jgi:hypothetical protein
VQKLDELAQARQREKQEEGKHSHEGHGLMNRAQGSSALLAVTLLLVFLLSAVLLWLWRAG